MEPLQFKSNGKLLLSGEYFVLDGAKALALPTRYGQSLQVSPGTDKNLIRWTSFDQEQKTWFEGLFSKKDLKPLQNSNQHIGQRLSEILGVAKALDKKFLEGENGLEITTRLDFQKNWGLGSSSTLLANIAAWAKVDPYLLLEKTFGGSGFDIACAMAKGPIIYQKGRKNKSKSVLFEHQYKSCLFFIYLGNKQNSREGIAHYRSLGIVDKALVEQVSNISERFLEAKTLSEFEALILEHEDLVADTINLEKVKDTTFPDYALGVIKSLGAWGGDFVLATSKANKVETQKWFSSKGFDTCLPYNEIIL